MRFLEVAEKGWIEVIVQPCEEHSDKKHHLVVGSNPGPLYLQDGHDIFYFEILLKLYCLFEKTENSRKRDQGWPIKNIISPYLMSNIIIWVQ